MIWKSVVEFVVPLVVLLCASEAAPQTAESVPYTQVVVKPDTARIHVDQTVQLVASVRHADGERLMGRGVRWESSSAAIASVEHGLVTGQGVGTATITAFVAGASNEDPTTVIMHVGRATVIVQGTGDTQGSVEVVPAAVALRPGRRLRLAAVVRSDAGNELATASVSWGSMNAAVATVDAAGMVTAQSVGTATITATSGGQSGTATVTVSQVSLGYPNEPVGALPVSTVVPLVHDHSSFVSTYPETDTQPFFAVRNVPEYSFTVTDNTAPFNPTKVGATHLTVSSVTTCGHQAGCAVGKLASTDKLRPPRDGSVKEWYGSFWFKIQPIGGLPAEMNIFGLKFYNFWGQATDGASYATSILNLYPRGVHANDPRNPEHRAPWYMAYYLATSDATPQRIGPYDFRWLKSDATLAGNYAPGGSKYAPQGAIFYASTSYHIETLIDYEIGRFRIFVDGEIYRDALSTDPGMTIPGIPRQPSHFEFSQVWGGARANYASEPAFNPFYLYYDQTYLSYTTQ